jgi:hypothetical protein
MVFNATFNNISVISWWSVLLVGEPPPLYLYFIFFKLVLKFHPAHVIKFVSDLLLVGCFLRFPSSIKLTATITVTEILLKVAIIKQQWTLKKVFSNSSHLEWRSGLWDTILKGTHPFKYVLIWFSKTYGWTDDKWWLKLTWSLASWAKKDFWIIYDYMAFSVSWPTGRMKGIGAWALNSYRWRIIQFKSFARWSFKKIFTLINSNVKTHFIHGDVHLGFLIISYMVMAILDSWYLHTWWWPSWIPDI